MNRKEKRGITLLALVITIIILLLLAAIAIQMAIGENGLIQKAEKTKRENAKSDLLILKESMKLGMEKYMIKE